MTKSKVQKTKTAKKKIPLKAAKKTIVKRPAKPVNRKTKPAVKKAAKPAAKPQPAPLSPLARLLEEVKIRKETVHQYLKLKDRPDKFLPEDIYR